MVNLEKNNCYVHEHLSDLIRPKAAGDFDPIITSALCPCMVWLQQRWKNMFYVEHYSLKNIFSLD